MQWLQQILVPYRTSLNKGNQRILLFLDGASTHAVDNCLNYCQQNNIRCFVLPAHTSHLLQPLDLGIFGPYKANYRKAISSHALDDVYNPLVPEATGQRVKMIARALISMLLSATCKSIKRCFFKSGLYPVSMENFLLYSHGIRDVPLDVMTGAKQARQDEIDNRNRRANAKGRRNIVNAMLIVNSSVDV